MRVILDPRTHQHTGNLFLNAHLRLDQRAGRNIHRLVEDRVLPLHRGAQQQPCLVGGTCSQFHEAQRFSSGGPRDNLDARAARIARSVRVT